MHSSHTNFSPKMEQALNQLISAYAQAEQTYAYAAATAAEYPQVYLKNFARFFQMRAHEATTMRNALMRYQFRRGATVERAQAQALQQYHYQQMQYPKEAEQMRETMKQLTSMEKQTQQLWSQFCEMATAEKDQESADYAKSQIFSRQFPAYAQMVRLTNALQQSACAQHFDAVFMKHEVEAANAACQYQANSQQQPQQQTPAQRQQAQPYSQQTQFQQQQVVPYSQQRQYQQQQPTQY